MLKGFLCGGLVININANIGSVIKYIDSIPFVGLIDKNILMLIMAQKMMLGIVRMNKCNFLLRV